MRRPRLPHAGHARGFTLVELSIVVTIVGILATLAVVGYRRMITSSHLAEATGMVNAIRVAEESVHAETGTYQSPSGGSIPWNGTNLGNLCPSTSPGSKKTGWNTACAGGGSNSWAILPVHVDGPVMYGYWAYAGTGTSISTSQEPSGYTASTPTGEWHSISAVGDPDGDGTYSNVWGTSVSNQLVIVGDGN